MIKKAALEITRGLKVIVDKLLSKIMSYKKVAIEGLR